MYVIKLWNKSGGNNTDDLFTTQSIRQVMKPLFTSKKAKKATGYSLDNTI